MTNQRYPWQRFWCPRDGAMSLADGGYLVDPAGEWGKAYNPHVRPFEEISETRCLVLLGEPGIGKSNAMREAFDLIAERAPAEGIPAPLWIDLRQFGDETRLLDRLTSPGDIREWVAGTAELEIYLDSLDECLLRVDTVATLIPEALEQLPIDRLRIRLACRTGSWPGTLEAALRQQFGEEAVGVYELAPLRRVDVGSAAASNGIDPDEFLREVASREVEALANRPVTLNFLLGERRNGGRLPTSKLELYEEGCRRLTGETSRFRLDAGHRGRLDAEARLSVAAGIAAATIFSNRDAIWIGPESDLTPAADLGLRDLRASLPDGGAQRDELLLEVLGGGLFSSRGPDKMGWAHQTYAEFLAAKYVAEARLEREQILSLITSPVDPDGRVVPQLHETAAWIAIMVPEVFTELAKRDPDTLLRGDIPINNIAQREVLTRELLTAYDAGRIVDADWGLGALFHKLKHPGLAGQLRPYITDRSKGLIVRRTAIRIAKACDLVKLQQELIDVALDDQELLSIRHVAASAAGSVADASHKDQLRPLLDADREEDPDDQLRGYVLEALWPDQLTAEELVQHLDHPRQPNLYGQYKRFIRECLPTSIRDEDLPTALRWVRDRAPIGYSLTDVFDDFVGEILIRAWQSSSIRNLMDDFADVALRSFARYQPIAAAKHGAELAQLIWDQPELRRLLVVRLLERMDDEDGIWVLWHPARPLIAEGDLAWLLSWIGSGASTARAREFAAEGVRRLLNYDDADQVSAVLLACGTSSELRAAFESTIEPIELDSSRAAALRASEEERLRRDREHAEYMAKSSEAVSPSPAERIIDSLAECDQADPDGFWHLAYYLSLNQQGRPDEVFEPDLTALPNWKVIGALGRERVVNAARQYLRERDPEPDRWFGTGIWFWPAYAGYKALYLIAAADPDYASTLTAEDWRRWACVIVAYPIYAQKDREVHNSIISAAYRYAADEVLRVLRMEIEKEIAGNGAVFKLDQFSACWDDRLSDVLLEMARRPETTIGPFRHLLAMALSHESSAAIAYAAELATEGLKDADERRTVAAALLLVNAPHMAWPQLRSVLLVGEDCSRRVLAALSHMKYGTLLRELPEEDLAALYISVSQWRPHSTTALGDADGCVGPEHEEAQFRDALLNTLKQRGTIDAVHAIRAIMEALPEVGWLKYALHEAGVNARSTAWNPPAPGEIFALGRDHDGRLVRSGRELSAAVRDSLRRLDVKLQGETPAAIDLWNGPDPSKRYRPKDEEAFSNYLKRHLMDDLSGRGIVVNREVEIRRSEGGRRGERTDLHVNAVRAGAGKNSTNVVTVIVEVKGCWHRELSTAMETQLVARYLRDNTCVDGLYLVGWFNCPQWDRNDPRRADAPKCTIDELREELQAQAASLSAGEVYVDAIVLNCALR